MIMKGKIKEFQEKHLKVKKWLILLLKLIKGFSLFNMFSILGISKTIRSLNSQETLSQGSAVSNSCKLSSPNKLLKEVSCTSGRILTVFFLCLQFLLSFLFLFLTIPLWLLTNPHKSMKKWINAGRHPKHYCLCIFTKWKS